MSDSGSIGFIDTSEVGGSSGESTSLDATTQPSTGGETQASGSNPAWDPFLAELPEYFHPKAKEHFSKWDENYRKLETDLKTTQDRYKPYEPYLEVGPEDLERAMNVYRNLNEDPLKVYNLLLEHVKSAGLLKDPDPTPTPGEPGTFLQAEVDPKFADIERRQAELDQRQAKMDEYVQTQLYNQQVAKNEQTLRGMVQSVVDKYGAVVDTTDLIQRMTVQMSQGRQIDAEAAFQDQKETFQRLYKAQMGGSRSAPSIIPPTGTIAPSGERKPEDMNEEETMAHFKRLWDIANSGG